MLVEPEVIRPAERSGIKRHGKFSFENGREMYDLLGNLLYTRKMEAPVRELCTNAFDEHVESGVEHPFVVKLPTTDSLEFSVTDFGRGMSEETLYSQYCNYGWSDKRQKIDQIGGFGLGAKSPIAYLVKPGCDPRPFQVESVHNGLLNVIVCMPDENGIPSIDSLISNQPTTRTSGTRVSFMVLPEDVAPFVKTALKVLSYFETLPKVVNGEVTRPDATRSGDAIRLESSLEGNKDGEPNKARIPSMLQLSNVAYPLTDFFKQGNPDIEAWMKAGIRIVRAAGPRIMHPSRESLSETAQAQAFVQNAFEEEINALHNRVIEAYRAAEGACRLSRLVAANQLMRQQGLVCFPVFAARFEAMGLTADEAADCVQANVSKLTLEAPVPSVFVGEGTPYRVQIRGIEFVKGKDDKRLPRLTRQDINYEGMFASKGSTRSRSVVWSPYKVQLTNTHGEMRPVYVFVADGPGAQRRIDSELMRMANAAIEAAEVHKVRFIPPIILVVAPRWAEKSSAFFDAMYGQALLSQSALGFSTAEIKRASSMELLPQFMTTSEMAQLAGSKREKAVYALRAKGELTVTAPLKRAYGEYTGIYPYEPQVDLVPGSILGNASEYSIYCGVTGLAWKGGKATSFKGKSFTTPELSVQPASAMRFYAAMGKQGPGVVWVGSASLAKGCQDAGMTELHEAMAQELKAMLKKLHPLVRALAWHSYTKAHYSASINTSWVGALLGDYEKVVAFLAHIKSSPAFPSMCQALPELAGPLPEAPFSQQVARAGTLIHLYVSAFRENTYVDQDGNHITVEEREARIREYHAFTQQPGPLGLIAKPLASHSGSAFLRQMLALAMCATNPYVEAD